MRVIEAEGLGLPEEWEVRFPVMLQRDTSSCNNARLAAEVGGMSERLKALNQTWVRAVDTYWVSELAPITTIC